MQRRSAVVAVVLLVVAGVAGCEGGESEPLTAEEFSGRLVAACQEVNQAVDTVQAEVQGNPREDPELASQFSGRIEDALGKFVGQLEGLRPPEDRQAALDAFTAVIADARAKFAAVPDAPADQRGAKVGEAFAALTPAEQAAQPLGISPLASCGQEEPEAPAQGAPQIEVGATEYAFDVKGPVPAGPVAFVLHNRGQEPHFMALVRLNAGVTTQQVIDAEMQGQDTAPLIAEQLEASDTAAPGAQSVLNVELAPGTYGMACFVTAPDGQPHAFKGMHATLQVG